MSQQSATEATELVKCRRTAHGGLFAARAFRAAAVTAAAIGGDLVAVHQWLAAALVLWLVPSLLVVGGLAHRAHTRRKAGRA